MFAVTSTSREKIRNDGPAMTMRSTGKRTLGSLLLVGLTLLTSFSATRTLDAQNRTKTAGAQACAALIRGGNLASVISADFESPPFKTSARGTAGREVTVHVPFCGVVGSIKPTSYSDIRFELWLPPLPDWNRKLAAVGSGSFLGAIEHERMLNVLLRWVRSHVYRQRPPEYDHLGCELGTGSSRARN